MPVCGDPLGLHRRSMIMHNKHAQVHAQVYSGAKSKTYSVIHFVFYDLYIRLFSSESVGSPPGELNGRVHATSQTLSYI